MGDESNGCAQLSLESQLLGETKVDGQNISRRIEDAKVSHDLMSWFTSVVIRRDEQISLTEDEEEE